MPVTQLGLPYQGRGPHARQSSYRGAERAAPRRGRQTTRYLALLLAGPLTDEGAAETLQMPRSSICSIRNALMDDHLVEPVGEAPGRYVRITLWALTARGTAVATMGGEG